jgi:hypothetical protein
MQLRNALLAIAGGLLLAAPASAQQPAAAPPAAAPPPPGVVAAGPSSPLPAVGVILDHRRELELSGAQVESLERLGLDVMREAIRRQADLTIAQLDLSVLLDREPHEAVDLETAETRIRDMERIRGEVQMGLVRAVETAKGQLTPDQRARLTALMATESSTEGNPSSQADPPPGVAIVANPAPAGGGRPSGPGGGSGGGRPPGSGGGHPRPPSGGGHHPHGDHHHGRVVVGFGAYWWGPYPYWSYPYWGYPYPAPAPIVVQPPVYIEQPPSGVWYYCPSSRAYYPTVPTCPEPWVTVAPRAG